MPKLEKKVADQVDSVESSGDREALPVGVYTARLHEVSAGQSKAGNPMWTWIYEITDPEFEGRRIWDHTVLQNNAHWKLKQVFDAFGFSTDSDTDEMVGEEVRLALTLRLIESGAQQGKMGNNVDRVLPLDTDGDEDDEAF